MSISLDRRGRPVSRRPLLKAALTYGLVAALCLVTGLLYTHFGRGMRSAFMSLAFCVPLGGALCYLLLAWLAPRAGSAWQRGIGTNWFASGLAILTIQCILRGILDIAGRASPYLAVFVWAGILCLALGLIWLAGAAGRKRR